MIIASTEGEWGIGGKMQKNSSPWICSWMHACVWIVYVWVWGTERHSSCPVTVTRVSHRGWDASEGRPGHYHLKLKKKESQIILRPIFHFVYYFLCFYYCFYSILITIFHY
jgi:hypothetical protein